MKLGELLTDWIRTGIPPQEGDIRQMAMLLDSLQMNNVPAKGWPNANEINFDEINMHPRKVLSKDLILQDKTCFILGDYLDLGIYDITLEGDSDLYVL